MGDTPHPRQWGTASLHSPIRGATQAASMCYARSPWGEGTCAFAGTTVVGGATAGSGLSRWDGTGSGGVPWLRPGLDRVGVGLATLVGTLVACVTHLRTPWGRNRVLLQHWNHRTRYVAYLQLLIVALVSFAMQSIQGRGWDRDAVLCPGFHPHPNLLPSREKGPDRLRGNEGG